MAAATPNLKVNIGADTSDFQKGTKDVKQGLKDLDKTGNEALASLGAAFGVNTGKIGQMTSAIKGAGQEMSRCENTGVKAFGNLLKSITPLQAGIAGLGLAGAVAGFQALRSEAENFKSTINGLNLEMATSAYISTYKQVLHDVNSDTGKAVAEAAANWEKSFGRFRANLGATFTTAFGQDQHWYDALSPTGIIRGWNTVKEGIDAATAAADRNEERASQLADIMKEELQVRREVADIEVEIAEQRRVLRDRSADVADRTAAEAELRRLINERSEKQADIAQRLYEVTQDMVNETNSGYEEVAQCVALYEQWKGRIAATKNEMAGVDRYANSISSGTSAAAKAAEELRREMEAINAVHSRWAGIGTLGSLSSVSSPGVTGPALSIVPRQQDTEYFRETFLAQLGEITVAVGLKADTEQIQDITAQVNTLVESGVTRSAELIGDLVGTLAGGGAAWGDFKSAALSAFGDMAIAVGKIAIQAGIASEGIQAALKLGGNGYLAIAAGAALVALGTAVKSSLSAVAGGDYSAAGGGYSKSSYSGGSGDYESREVTVRVSGVLTADGDKLQAVLDSASNKRYYTGG